MALTAAQITQVFEVFCVPQGGAATAVIAVSSRSGGIAIEQATTEAYEFAAVVTDLTAKLAALTATGETRVTTLLTRWDTLTSYDPLRIHKASGGAEGEIVDYEKERCNIRAALANIIGFAVPGGGFAAEARRNFGAGCRVMR